MSTSFQYAKPPVLLALGIFVLQIAIMYLCHKFDLIHACARANLQSGFWVVPCEVDWGSSECCACNDHADPRRCEWFPRRRTNVSVSQAVHGYTNALDVLLVAQTEHSLDLKQISGTILREPSTVCDVDPNEAIIYFSVLDQFLLTGLVSCMFYRSTAIAFHNWMIYFPDGLEVRPQMKQVCFCF